MKRDEALALLRSTNARERLEAARFLERVATPEDADALRTARQAESVVWIRDSLPRALNLAAAGTAPLSEPTTVDVVSVEDELDAVYATAVRDIADQLVHELAPLVGAARLHAADELHDTADSKTRRDLDRIAAVLHAIDDLARASSASVEEDLNLADCVSEAVAAGDHAGIDIQLASDDPFSAIGDPALILIVLRNGLANAVDAITGLLPDQRMPIVVSWGRTGKEYRVSILDRGPGLPAEAETLFDLGVTTKGPDHPGLGLALARRAALSLRGNLVIKNADPTGVLFELRWPREK